MSNSHEIENDHKYLQKWLSINSFLNYLTTSHDFFIYCTLFDAILIMIFRSIRLFLDKIILYIVFKNWKYSRGSSISLIYYNFREYLNRNPELVDFLMFKTPISFFVLHRNLKLNGFLGVLFISLFLDTFGALWSSVFKPPVYLKRSCFVCVSFALLSSSAWKALANFCWLCHPLVTPPFAKSAVKCAQYAERLTFNNISEYMRKL